MPQEQKLTEPAQNDQQSVRGSPAAEAAPAPNALASQYSKPLAPPRSALQAGQNAIKPKKVISFASKNDFIPLASTDEEILSPTSMDQEALATLTGEEINNENKEEYIENKAKDSAEETLEDVKSDQPEEEFEEITSEELESIQLQEEFPNLTPEDIASIQAKKSFAGLTSEAIASIQSEVATCIPKISSEISRQLDCASFSTAAFKRDGKVVKLSAVPDDFWIKLSEEKSTQRKNQDTTYTDKNGTTWLAQHRIIKPIKDICPNANTRRIAQSHKQQLLFSLFERELVDAVRSGIVVPYQHMQLNIKEEDTGLEASQVVNLQNKILETVNNILTKALDGFAGSIFNETTLQINPAFQERLEIAAANYSQNETAFLDKSHEIYQFKADKLIQKAQRDMLRFLGANLKEIRNKGEKSGAHAEIHNQINMQLKKLAKPAAQKFNPNDILTDKRHAPEQSEQFTQEILKTHEESEIYNAYESSLFIKKILDTSENTLTVLQSAEELVNDHSEIQPEYVKLCELYAKLPDGLQGTTYNELGNLYKTPEAPLASLVRDIERQSNLLSKLIESRKALDSIIIHASESFPKTEGKNGLNATIIALEERYEKILKSSQPTNERYDALIALKKEIDASIFMQHKKRQEKLAECQRELNSADEILAAFQQTEEVQALKDGLKKLKDKYQEVYENHEAINTKNDPLTALKAEIDAFSNINLKPYKKFLDDLAESKKVLDSTKEALRAQPEQSAQEKSIKSTLQATLIQLKGEYQKIISSDKKPIDVRNNALAKLNAAIFPVERIKQEIKLLETTQGALSNLPREYQEKLDQQLIQLKQEYQTCSVIVDLGEKSISLQALYLKLQSHTKQLASLRDARIKSLKRWRIGNAIFGTLTLLGATGLLITEYAIGGAVAVSSAITQAAFITSILVPFSVYILPALLIVLGLYLILSAIEDHYICKQMELGRDQAQALESEITQSLSQTPTQILDAAPDKALAAHAYEIQDNPQEGIHSPANGANDVVIQDPQYMRLEHSAGGSFSMIMSTPVGSAPQSPPSINSRSAEFAHDADVKKEQDAAAQHDQAQPAEGSRRRASISFLPSASKGEDSSDVISQPRTRSLSL